MELEIYKAGKFTFSADGEMVLVTKDTASGIVNVSSYYYETHEIACDMAWRMHCKQLRA